MGAETDKSYKVPLKSKDSLRVIKRGDKKVEGENGERDSVPSSLQT